MAEFSTGSIAVPVTRPGSPPSLAGTAFFVRLEEQRTWLMTAGHVTDGEDRLEVVRLPTGTSGESGVSQLLEHSEVADVVRSPDHDIAMLRVDAPWSGAGVFPFGTSDELDASCLCIEFSQSLPVADSEEFHIQPARRVGNIVQQLWGNPVNGARPLTLQLSWPAFSGASGSPVIDRGTGTAAMVVGMIVANVDRELLPEHLEEITTDGDVTERRIYRVPNATTVGYPQLEEFARLTLG